MKTVGIRELADHASAVVGEVTDTSLPVVITKRGQPVAVLSAIDETAWEDFILTHSPAFAAQRKEAEDAFTWGERGRPLMEVIAELAEEDGASSRA